MKKKEMLFIAEVGQNHQGDLSKALEYIKIFAGNGANVIKFQTRNNKYLFSDSAYDKEYNSENSFADYYGEHREKLELDLKDLKLIKKECKKYDVMFMSTPFDEPSLNALIESDVDMIKVASFDLGNIPFLNKIAKTGLPVVISTGGGDIDIVKRSVEELSKGTIDITVLHCVSEYPCTHDRLGLETIKTYLEIFPEYTIGISDHFSGILSGPVSYMLGARAFEKHVTMNRSWKGTDHSFALEPHGFGNFVRDIKRVPEMLPQKKDGSLGKEPVFQKLGKSIVAAKDIDAGDIITIEDLTGKIFTEQYTPVRESINFIGVALKNKKKRGDFLTYKDINKSN